MLTSREGWTYCEGMACGFLSPHQIPKLCMYIPHAWCLDERGLVVETVWRELSHSYFGVTVPAHDVAVSNIETDRFGPVYPELARGLVEKFGLPFDP